ncbi:MAG: SUMF1/EgtB/PvdO family nonheme iron enzyme, partial [Acidihalobacter sp.]
VTLTSYSISKYKVTRAQIVLYSEANHLPKPDTGPDIPKAFKLITWELSPPSSPTGVTWNQAQGYCKWLGKLTGKPFALPTEAQWEYAARDRGRFILFATDNGKQELNRNVPTGAFTKKLSKPWHGMHISIPSPVGLFPPSPLGLYGMTNGQYEWVRDWFSADYYSHSKNSVDPTGPRTGTEKVVRGGGSLYLSTTINRYHRSTKRSESTFRCVL